jgi:head-tail adaptor
MSRPHLTRRLIVEAPQRAADGGGGFTESFAPLGEVWAEVATRGAGREVGAASRLQLKITVRAAPQGAPSRPAVGMRFRDGVRVFEIEAVTESDPSGRYLTCFAVEEVGA